MVVDVVRNRTNFGRPFAPTICGAVYQKGQFVFTRNAKLRNVSFKKIARKHMDVESKQVMDAVEVAINAVVLKAPVITTATHFCSAGDKCRFENVKKVGKIGNHTMYEYEGNS